MDESEKKNDIDKTQTGQTLHISGGKPSPDGSARGGDVIFEEVDGKDSGRILFRSLKGAVAVFDFETMTIRRLRPDELPPSDVDRREGNAKVRLGLH